MRLTGQSYIETTFEMSFKHKAKISNLYKEAYSIHLKFD